MSSLEQHNFLLDLLTLYQMGHRARTVYTIQSDIQRAESQRDIKKTDNYRVRYTCTYFFNRQIKVLYTAAVKVIRAIYFSCSVFLYSTQVPVL